MAVEILSNVIKTLATEKIDSLKQLGKEISDKGIKEYTKGQIENLKDAEKDIITKINDIKNMSPEQLQNKLEETLKAKEQTDSNEVNEQNERRPLNEDERKELKEKTGWPDSFLDKITVDENGDYYFKCRNEDLLGKVHEVTGVPFVEKEIEIDGVKLKVVVPEFPYVFETNIPKELWEKGDNAIFSECTKKLWEYLEQHPEEKKKFTPQQLEQIKNGEPYIKGYTWHHSEVPGKMQLVKSDLHNNTGHTGGCHLWGKDKR